MRNFAGMFMLVVAIVGLMAVAGGLDRVQTGAEWLMVAYWTVCLFISGFAGVGLLVDSDRDTL
jgi:hypothetical protein